MGVKETDNFDVSLLLLQLLGVVWSWSSPASSSSSGIGVRGLPGKYESESRLGGFCARGWTVEGRSEVEVSSWLMGSVNGALVSLSASVIESKIAHGKSPADKTGDAGSSEGVAVVESKSGKYEPS